MIPVPGEEKRSFKKEKKNTEEWGCGRAEEGGALVRYTKAKL